MLNYPEINLDGDLTDVDATFSFDSTFSGSLDATATTVGLISTYSGNDYVDSTWAGASYTNAWLGLAIDRTSSTTMLQNIFYNLNQQDPVDMDTMVFNLVVDFGNTNEFNVGVSSDSGLSYFTSVSSEYFAVNIDGFMVTTQPTTDVLRISIELEAFEAVIDTASMTTFIPKD